jgi:hypothetical protein
MPLPERNSLESDNSVDEGRVTASVPPRKGWFHPHGSARESLESVSHSVRIAGSSLLHQLDATVASACFAAAIVAGVLAVAEARWQADWS